MPSPFQGIDVASRALRAFQRALDTTGHNIANVNTPGYTRQTVDMAQMEPGLFWSGGSHALGNGVNITSINRIKDMFLEARRMGAQADLGKLSTLTGGLQQIEGAFLEPGEAGIADALTKFFNAWSGLAANPSQAGLRANVQLAGQTLADRVRGSYMSLQSVKTQASAEIKQTISDVQTLANNLAELNKKIREKAIGGAEPNDLLDARDATLRELSSLVDIKTHQFQDGSVAVYVGSFTLVDSAGAQQFPTTFDPAAMSISSPSQSYQVKSGKLAGLFQTFNETVSRQAALDDFANNLRTSINSVHSTGTNSLGGTGLNFFADVPSGDPQTGAIDFKLDPAIKADANAIATGVSGEPGDGGLALAISQLRDTGIAGLGNKSFGAYYGDLVADVGRTSAMYGSNLSTHESIVSQIDNQIQAVSGVNLDDEMADMLRFQRSYQAAARALSLFDQVTEDLIGMLRR